MISKISSWKRRGKRSNTQGTHSRQREKRREKLKKECEPCKSFVLC